VSPTDKTITVKRIDGDAELPEQECWPVSAFNDVDEMVVEVKRVCQQHLGNTPGAKTQALIKGIEE
jgi:hypothetical protein